MILYASPAADSTRCALHDVSARGTPASSCDGLPRARATIRATSQAAAAPDRKMATALRLSSMRPQQTRQSSQ
eukprot:6013618-Prymnesium_polylepis.1